MKEKIAWKSLVSDVQEFFFSPTRVHRSPFGTLIPFVIQQYFFISNYYLHCKAQVQLETVPNSQMMESWLISILFHKVNQAYYKDFSLHLTELREKNVGWNLIRGKHEEMRKQTMSASIYSFQEGSCFVPPMKIPVFVRKSCPYACKLTSPCVY